MIEARGKLYFAQEPVGPESRCNFGMQYLDCNGAVVAKVIGEINRRHPSAAQLAADAVPGIQCRFDAVNHDERARKRSIEVGKATRTSHTKPEKVRRTARLTPRFADA